MKKTTASLRSRLLVLVGGGLLGLIVGQYAATALVMNEHQEEMLNAVLAEQMQYSLQLYHDAGRVLVPNVPRMNFYAFPLGHPGADVPMDFYPFGPGSHEVDIGDTEYHFVVHDENGKRFLLAYNAEQYEDNFTELMLVLGTSCLLTASMALLGIYWLSGRVLLNLSRLSAAVRQQASGPLAHDDMEAEVLALAKALDDYRTRQTLLLEREREFSGQLSHELRTPLSVVRGQAELIALQYTQDERLHKRAQEIMAQVDRMRGMIEQLLRLARSTRVLVRETVPLHALAERIWSDLSQTSSSHTRLSNRIPLKADVQADPLLLELILRNAFANARQHANGAELRLSFDDSVNGAVLNIEDFDPDGRLGHMPMDDGAGLGMIILRRACTALGWECHIEAVSTGVRLQIELSKR